jgi:shikimate kinase
MKDPNFLKKYQNYHDKNIALIGHMGSGKSTIGKLIAKKLKLRYLDSDQLIEKNTNKTIYEIFKSDGETKFRTIEESTILSLKNKKNLVLSLGGGSIISAKVRQLLNKNYITLFLDIDLSILVKRLKYSNKRPLIAGQDIETKIKELDIFRRKYYLLADIILKEYDNPSETLINFLIKYKKLNEKNY